MKVALVIEHFDATRGGAEQVAVFLVTELAQRGHEVHVLCHDAQRRLGSVRAATQGASHDARRSEQAHGRVEAEVPPGVTIHRLKGFKLSTGLGFRMFGQRAAAWCQRHRPDVAHSLTVAWAGDIYHPEAGIYARMQQRAVESRSTRRSAALKRWLQRLSGKQRALLALEEKAAGPIAEGGAWKIISISGGMARELAEHYGLGPERLVRLDNPRLQKESTDPKGAAARAADRAWFRAHYGLSEQDRLALFVGHDFRRKGLRWAIEAVARTQGTTRWKLAVVGLGKVREYVELVEQLGLLEQVKFVGPTREVERLYHAADALLLPVFYDPAPLVVIEALTHGLPVISTRNLGSADIVESHQAGAIVDDPRDVEALAAALDSLPTAGPARDALAARARAAAEGMPGDVFVSRVEELYQAFLRHRQPATRNP